MSYRTLMKEFVDRANTAPRVELGAPIAAKASNTPVLAVEKWSTESGTLRKNFHFRIKQQRDSFVQELFAYEDDVQHSAVLIVKELSVIVSLLTHSMQAVTQLDKDYAKHADSLYKQVTWTSTIYPDL